MNEYVFYTFEGFTESPTDKECENLQILGFEDGENIEDAKQKLLEDNEWIKELDFDFSEIKSKQLLSVDNKKDIQTVIDYFENNEKQDNNFITALENLKNILN